MALQKKIKAISSTLLLIGVLACSAAMIMPFFHSGFFPIHDDTQIARISQMTQALRDGEFPVRWVRDLGYGYGYPLFNFYAPLPYYFGSLFLFLGFDSVDATKITFAFALLISGISMYVFARSFWGSISAFVASVVYMYFPYHAVNTFVRGDLGELYAYAFFPWVFLGFYRLYYHVKTRKKNTPLLWILLLTLSLSAITISHNLSIFMLMLLLLPTAGISLLFVSEKKKYAIWISSALFGSLVLSSFYVLPVLFEMHWTNVLSQIGGGSYYPDHFVCLEQLWNSPWGYGGSVHGCVDGMSFRLGKSNILFFIIAIGLYAFSIVTKRQTYRFLDISLFSLLLFSVLLLLPQSLVLWRSIPYIDFLQFPWRFLNFVGVFLSVSIAVGIAAAQRVFGTQKALLLAAGVVMLTVWFNGKLFTPQKYATFPRSYYTQSTYVRWYASHLSDEYLPKNFQKPVSSDEIVRFPVTTTTGKVARVYQTTTYLRATLTSSKEASVHLAIAYFPTWHVFIDKEQIPVTIDSTGMKIHVPPGTHTIEAQYIQTTVEKIANTISLIGFIAMLVVFSVQYRRIYDKTS